MQCWIRLITCFLIPSFEDDGFQVQEEMQGANAIDWISGLRFVVILDISDGFFIEDEELHFQVFVVRIGGCGSGRCPRAGWKVHALMREAMGRS
jgi:hypothetical protein